MTDPFAADVAAMCAGPGSVPVTCGATTVPGLLLRQLEDSSDAHGAPSQVAHYILTIPAGALGVPTRNAAVTVAAGPLAGAYRFRQLVDGDGDGYAETWALRKDGT